VAGGIEELFRAHWRLVVGYLARRTGDTAVAEELAQETFYRATRAFLGWRGGSPAAWLLAIARNVLVDHMRRRGRELVPLSDQLLDQVESEDVTSEEISAALSSLSVKQRRLLELIYLEGYSHAEVAAMAGMSAGAIKTAVWRARQTFLERYREMEKDEA
jgi:RNA polymerase sigma factor (sigma-70 family)